MISAFLALRAEILEATSRWVFGGFFTFGSGSVMDEGLDSSCRPRADDCNLAISPLVATCLGWRLCQTGLGSNIKY